MNRLWPVVRLILIVAVVGTVLSVLIGEGALLHQQIISRHNEQLRYTNDSLSREIEMLEERIDRLKKDSLMLETIARTRFGMSREGELVYRFVPEAEARVSPTP